MCIRDSARSFRVHSCSFKTWFSGGRNSALNGSKAPRARLSAAGSSSGAEPRANSQRSEVKRQSSCAATPGRIPGGAGCSMNSPSMHSSMHGAAAGREGRRPPQHVAFGGQNDPETQIAQNSQNTPLEERAGWQSGLKKGGARAAASDDVACGGVARAAADGAAAPLSLFCLLYTSPSPRDRTRSRMPSSA